MPWLHICSYGVQILNKSPYQFPLGPLFGFLSDDTEALQRDWQKIPTFPILIRPNQVLQSLFCLFRNRILLHRKRFKTLLNSDLKGGH